MLYEVITMRAYHMDTEIPDPQSPLHLTIIQGLVLSYNFV